MDCNEFLKDVKNDPQLLQLLGRISEKNKLKISCLECGDQGVERKARGFLINSSPMELVLCTNRMKSSEQKREVLVHELVHAFDYAYGRYDFLAPPGLAATEIRAAREAECSGVVYKWFDFLRKDCVKTCAVQSTSNMFPKEAAAAVSACFTAAYADNEPF